MSPAVDPRGEGAVAAIKAVPALKSPEMDDQQPLYVGHFRTGFPRHIDSDSDALKNAPSWVWVELGLHWRGFHNGV